MSFSQELIDSVWNKATVQPGNEPDVFRKDQCGAWIQKSKYGHRDSKYGWEVDHITAVANSGTDILSNLRPLHWGNNSSRGKGRLNTQLPAVTSEGTDNIQLNADNSTYSKM
ncbi:HNH endonuclease [Morganella morganii]|nr:HNH endonuclease [Morganella morganii]